MTRVVVVVVGVIIAVQLASASGLGMRLEPGEIGFKSSPLTPWLYRIEATDGSAALLAVVSRDHGFITCTRDDSEATVKTIIDDPAAVVEITGQKQVHDMWRRCLLTAAQSSAPPSGAQRGLPTDHRTVLQTSSHTTAAALGKSSGRRAAVANTTSDPTFAGLPFEPDYNPTDPEGPGAHLAIVPGTRWCGNGNIASSYEDLGIYSATDACCRDHDHCPYYIPGLTTKYHCNNQKLWTLSYCGCDDTFFRCLKEVNDDRSNMVGQLFYGLLGVQCFDFADGEYCSRYHWTHLWCEDHENGPMAVIQDFPLQWSDSIQEQVPIGR